MWQEKPADGAAAAARCRVLSDRRRRESPRAGCRPAPPRDAGESRRTSGCAIGSSRSRRRLRAASGGPSRPSGRTPPAWSPATPDRRDSPATAQQRRRSATGSSPSAGRGACDSRAAWAAGKQVVQRAGGQPQETIVAGDAHDHLRDRQRDDLRIGHHSPGVLGPLRQEIVCGAEDRCEEQVEVGEHRGPLGSTARIGTADFDRSSSTPSPPSGRGITHLGVDAALQAGCGDSMYGGDECRGAQAYPSDLRDGRSGSGAGVTRQRQSPVNLENHVSVQWVGGT